MVRRNPFLRVTLATALVAQALVPAGVAYADRTPPLLANERHLLVDAQARLLGIEREDRDTDDHLLDTTYDEIHENLLLDTNMLFEEYLQEELEHSVEINACAQNAAVFITKKLPDMPSLTLVKAGATNEYRAKRIEWICHADRLNCNNGVKSLVEAQTKAYNDADWTAAINEHCPSNVPQSWTAQNQAACKGYGKLLKMLYTQFPYFGGSPEFKHGVINLEYWMYQLSTLTKDPGRALSGSDSPKPILDYVTPADSLLPTYNPRNLGLGMTDGPKDKMAFEKLPWRMKAKLFFEMTGGELTHNAWYANLVSTAKRPDAKLDSPDAVGAYWDAKLDDSERKKIFGDLLRLPWSFAHMLGHEDVSQAEANVVGVRGNILLTPTEAKVLYLADFANKDPITWSLGKTQARDVAAKEFEDKHADWYAKTRAGFLPIIGGMSGHTLGYLNLYIAALKAANKTDLTASGPDGYGDLCTLERFRAVMMAGLIGNKRHHSYAEVMSASHNFAYTWGTGKETLTHASRTNYHDLFASKDEVIKKAAQAALDRLNHELGTSALHQEPNTVLRLVTQRISSHVDGKKVGKNNIALTSALKKYVGTHTTNTDVATMIELVKTEVANGLKDGD